MSFNSAHYLIFFPIVVLLFFVLSPRLRWVLLLLSSCYFYMAFIPVYILILFLLIIVDYTMGLLIERSAGRLKRLYLLVSLVATVSILFCFKYFNFFHDSLTTVLGLVHAPNTLPYMNLILPLGLSFHTFQSLSYVFEVYYGRQKAEHHLGIYATYVMFFPQLVAGPIERPQNLLTQLHAEQQFSVDNLVIGLRFILWGLFKKIVVADRLALYVNEIFDKPMGSSGIYLVIASIFFAFQIYCDFSGYSDIAVGSARALGISLSKNFNLPYISSSITEFWHRWHISLSTWFRDYVYIPLGGNKVNKFKWARNILIVFLISGLWHGANWTYVFWGFLNGVYVLIEAMISSLRKKLAPTPVWMTRLSQTLTFLLVCFTWIFFRAKNLADALHLSRYFIEPLWTPVRSIHTALHLFDVRLDAGRQMLGSVLLLLVVHVGEILRESPQVDHLITPKAATLRWAFYVAALFLILNAGVVEDIPFIYFQF